MHVRVGIYIYTLYTPVGKKYLVAFGTFGIVNSDDSGGNESNIKKHPHP